MTKLEHYGNAFATLAEAVDVASNALSAVRLRAGYIALLHNIDPSPAAKELIKAVCKQVDRDTKRLQEIHIQIQDLLEVLSEKAQEEHE